MIFKESSTISDWHYLQLSEPEFLALIAEGGDRFYGFVEGQFTPKTAGNSFDREVILSEDIDAWLRQHCGFAQVEYWGFPRILYHEAQATEMNRKLEEAKTRWDEVFTSAHYNQRNWRFHPLEKRIYFRRKDHAMAFKLAFHSVEDGFVG